MTERLDALKAARSRMLESRDEFAKALAAPFDRNTAERSRLKFIETQNVIDALDRAIASEAQDAAPRDLATNSQEAQSLIYESSNGDVWSLTRDPTSGAPAVLHQPNLHSGGTSSYIDIDRFLRETPTGPQHQALRHILDTTTPQTR